MLTIILNQNIKDKLVQYKQQLTMKLNAKDTPIYVMK